jgi:CheY-like chemotaxis protein
MNQEKEEPILNILISEDDDAAAHLIKTNLKRAGLDSVFFRTRNGEETVAFLENCPVPGKDKLIVLLDIRMPKMDGTRVLEYMKGSEAFSKIPVIMLTTSDRPKEVDLCYRLGCNSYLKKQVDYTKFVDSIKKLASFIEVSEIPCFGEYVDE